MKNRGYAFMGIGFELVGLIVVAIYLGSWLDKKLGWQGYGAVVMIFVAFIGWLVHLIQMTRKFEAEDEADDSSKS